MQTLKLGSIDVEVIKRDIKNVHLSVYPPAGRVKISAPKRMSLATIRVFAISKLGWIRQQRQKLRAQERETPRAYIERESHYAWGKRYRLYFNQSGNSWSQPTVVPAFPRIDSQTAVTVVDLLGNGTACLVWSSPLPGDVRRPMRYIDFMGGDKPHLLIKTVNNLGAETRIQYATSTRFYLQDKLNGNPWLTRLPFPVHVVERVETFDWISRNHFVTRYAYHHGYFDGEEREFRGFGMIELRDTEELAALTNSDDFPDAGNIDEASHVPPILTKTWYHTEAYIDRNHISDYFAGLLDAEDTGEYYREPGLTDAQARLLLLDDTVMPAGLTADEEREACRSLKGRMLRQEVYALDGTVKQQHPYAVVEQNFKIGPVQRRGDNRHAVFFTHALEAITYHYERNPLDPRVQHELTLEVDRFGNVLKSVSVGYGRRQADPTLEARDQLKQTETHITCAETGFTNSVENPDEYRTPLLSESRSYELTGLNHTGRPPALHSMICRMPAPPPHRLNTKRVRRRGCCKNESSSMCARSTAATTSPARSL